MDYRRAPNGNGYDSPEGGQEDELSSIQLRQNQVADESLESTRRMMNLCEESQDAGAQTLVMLNEQGEQLDRIEEGMDKINKDMVTAEKNLEGLEKCCGLCVLPWKRSKKFDDSDFNGTWKGDDSSGPQEGPRMIGGNAGPTGPMVSRIQNDAREDEMEENMHQVSNMVSNLKNMAVDMGNEIGQQNEAIDKINQGTAATSDRIDAANKRAQRIVREK